MHYAYDTISIAGCGTDADICEVLVDYYLDQFCAQATLIKNSSTIYNTSAIVTMAELPCPTRTTCITIHLAHLTTKTGIYTMSVFTMHAMLGSASAVHMTDHSKQASNASKHDLHPHSL